MGQGILSPQRLPLAPLAQGFIAKRLTSFPQPPDIARGQGVGCARPDAAGGLVSGWSRPRLARRSRGRSARPPTRRPLRQPSARRGPRQPPARMRSRQPPVLRATLSTLTNRVNSYQPSQLLPTDNDSSAVGRLAHRAVPTTGHRATAFVDDGEVDKVALGDRDRARQILTPVRHFRKCIFPRPSDARLQQPFSAGFDPTRSAGGYPRHRPTGVCPSPTGSRPPGWSEFLRDLSAPREIMMAGPTGGRTAEPQQGRRAAR